MIQLCLQTNLDKHPSINKQSGIRHKPSCQNMIDMDQYLKDICTINKCAAPATIEGTSQYGQKEEEEHSMC